MKLINFNPDKPTPEEIEDFYLQREEEINARFDTNINPRYNLDYGLWTEEQIIAEQKRMLNELSVRSSFFLLAYIETLFRTDFTLRLETNNGKRYQDNITKAYKELYVPGKRPFQYPLDDVIFKTWKENATSKEMLDILNTLPQYFDFRNWMAHGRYFMIKEDNYLAKYNYQSVKMLLGKINQVFGKKFKYKNFGLEGT